MPEPQRKDFLTLEALDTRVTALEGVMEDFKLQISDVGNEVRANTRLTEEIHSNTADLVEAIGDLKAFGRWGKRFASFARYTSYVLIFIGSVWALIKTGTWPK